MKKITSFIAFLLAICSTALTLADADPVIAIVLKKEIRTSAIQPSKKELAQWTPASDQREFQDWLKITKASRIAEAIVKPLVDAYAKQNSINATDEDVRDVIKFWNVFGFLESSDPITQQEITLAKEKIRKWKVMKALHAKYGGRSLPGITDISPVDAIRDFAYDEEKKGSFQIIDEPTHVLFKAAMEPSEANFSMSANSFVDEVKTREYFETPWWIKMVKNHELRKQ